MDNQTGHIMPADHNTGYTRPFCELHPEYIPAADPLGHILPGLGIVGIALYLYWVSLSRRFKAIAPGSNYKFDGSFVNLTLPWIERWPLELVILVLESTLALVIYNVKLIVFEGKTPFGSLHAMVNDDHFSIYMAGYIYYVVALLHKKKSLHVPEHAAQLCLAGFTMTFCGALYAHLVGRCPYDTEMHKMFGFLPSIAATICFMAQIWKRDSFLLAVGASFWLGLSGMGLVVISFFGWIFPVWSTEWRDLDTARKTRDMPRFFFLTFDAMLLVYIVLYLLFGALRGVRLGKRNPVYSYHRNEDDESLPSYRKVIDMDEEKRSLLTDPSR